MIIENVTPEIGAGRFAIKRTSGGSVVVEADIFADGGALPDSAGFAPGNAANFRIHIGGDESRHGGMVARQAQGEIILQLLFRRKAAAEEVLPTREDAQKALRRFAEFDQAARFRSGKSRLQEWRRIADLCDQRFRTDPVGPGSARGFQRRASQIPV